MSKGYPIISGFNRSSEAGDDKFAFSIFLDGCNLQCPYCMNPDLTTTTILEPIDNKWLEDMIVEDRPMTIHISGGEPTSNMWNLRGLFQWLEYLKQTHGLSFNIGMSTNGTIRNRVESVLKYLSFVTMDFKGDPFDYAVRFNGGTYAFANMIESWRDIRVGKQICQYEIRTTLSPIIINEDKIKFMSNFFINGEKWILQPYRATDNMLLFDKKTVKEYSKEEINNLFNIAVKESGADVEVRYV